MGFDDYGEPPGEDQPTPVGKPWASIERAVTMLRQSFPNDGAAGETIHTLCDSLEAEHEARKQTESLLATTERLRDTELDNYRKLNETWAARVAEEETRAERAETERAEALGKLAKVEELATEWEDDYELDYTLGDCAHSLRRILGTGKARTQ